MAKRSVSFSFRNAEISKENGRYIITEFVDDSTVSNSLSLLLDNLQGNEISHFEINLEYDLLSWMCNRKGREK